MPRSHVILDVSSTAVELTLCRGAVAGKSSRIPLDHGDFASIRSGAAAAGEQWTVALDQSLETLTRTVDEIGASGLPTTIVYSGPGSFVAVGSCAASAGRSSAIRAAHLALSSIATFPVATNPHDVRVLHIERKSRTSASPKIHTIGATDLDQTVAGLVAWASASGLNVQACVPAEAAIAVAASHVDADCSEPVAVLWLGSHQSVLALRSESRLELVRTISAGTESFVEALQRPIRRRRADSSSNDSPVMLDRSAARSLLHGTGIPAPDDDLLQISGCDGAAILPHLQPVVQRLAVEIKQSLRFGTSEPGRSGHRLMVVGEGGAVPRLAEAIAAYAGVSLRACGPNPPSLAVAVATLRDHLPALVAVEAAERELTRGVRRGLVAGLVAASALLAVEGASIFASLAKERQRLAANAVNAVDIDALAGLERRALEARVEATALTSRIARTLGDSPDWSAVLAVLSSATPSNVRIRDLEMASEPTRDYCRIRAYVRLAEASDPPAIIRQFVESLSQSPVVESVNMGAAQLTTINGHDVQAFELNVSVVAVPPPSTRSGDLTRTAALNAPDSINGARRP